MKKLLAIVLLAVSFIACNSNADGGSNADSTDAMTPSPSTVDTSTLRTDTMGPQTDSGMNR